MWQTSLFQKILGMENNTQYSKTIFGLAIHSALEYWGKCKIENKPVILKEVIDEFNEYFDNHYKEITVWELIPMNNLESKEQLH